MGEGGPAEPQSELRRGWPKVAAAAALMAVTSGVWYSGTVFLIPLLEEFGRDYAATAGIFSVFTVLVGAFGVLTGHLVDRLGHRRVILGGGLLLLAGHLASSLATARWHLYLTHGILTALSISSVGWTPVSVFISRAFRQRTGLVLGIASSGVGVGIMLFVPFTQTMIQLAGWRAAFAALGACGALIVLPVAWWALPEAPARALSPRAGEPAGPRREPEGGFPHGLGAAVRTRAFWLVAATFTALNAPVQMVMTHQVAHLVEAGQPALFVAGLVGLVGLASTPGKIFWGWLSDRWWLEWTYPAGILILTGAVTLLLGIGPGSARGTLYLFAVLIGFGYSMAPALTPVMGARFFAGPHFGLLFGTLNMVHLAGGAVGVWVAGYVHDLAGSYRPAFQASYASLALAILCVWLAAPRRQGAPRT